MGVPCSKVIRRHVAFLPPHLIDECHWFPCVLFGLPPIYLSVMVMAYKFGSALM
jgi:hypothetical protein